MVENNDGSEKKQVQVEWAKLMESLSKLEEEDNTKNEVESKVDDVENAIESSSIDKKDELSTYLFISFDLVNSTSFKSLFPGRWPAVFRRFYELIEDKVLKTYTNSSVWRYVGDEVLFYKKITIRSDLHNVLNNALNIIRAVTDSLNLSYPHTKQVLFLKSTLWLATARYVPPDKLKESDLIHINDVDNLIITSEHNGKTNTDFLGADIDLGFRIARFAHREKVIVSAELAYLLYQDRGIIEEKHDYNVEDELKIVGYELLKGIWNGRRYPIIWYHDGWNDPDKMFAYDDHYDSDVIRDIKSGKLTESSNIKYLKKILEDNNRYFKIEEFKSTFTDQEAELAFVNMSQYNMVEVHCVAICFNVEGHILLGKRPSHKRRFPGVWEFGCGQLKKYQDFQQCLIESYKEDFGAELEFRNGLIPVSTFVIDDQKEQRKIPGVIFIAEVANAQTITGVYSKTEHSDVSWFNPQELENIDESNYIENFKDSVTKAVKARNDLKEV